MNLIAPTATVQVPDWVAYPDRDWVQITPAEAGLNARKFAVWLASLDVRGASFGGETTAVTSTAPCSRAADTWCTPGATATIGIRRPR